VSVVRPVEPRVVAALPHVTTWSTRPRRVYVTPAEAHPFAWNQYSLSLRALADVARPRIHELVATPDDADMIIVTDFQDDDVCASLRANQVLARYPDKCFVYTQLDRTAPLVRGVYASVPRSPFDLGRLRAGCYVYEACEWRNQFVSAEAAARTEKDLLLSFVGRASAKVRVQLLTTDWHRPDVVVTQPRYNHWDRHTPDRAAHQRRYVETLARSRFVICPRGEGSSSERLFEVMEMGLVPVIISDSWVAPVGPKWEDFSVRVAERDVANVVSIVERYESRYRQRGRLARDEWLRWFSPQAQFNSIVEACADIERTASVSERDVRRLWPVLIASARAKKATKRERDRVGQALQRLRHGPGVADRLCESPAGQAGHGSRGQALDLPTGGQQHS